VISVITALEIRLFGVDRSGVANQVAVCLASGNTTDKEKLQMNSHEERHRAGTYNWLH
jgi:hypothetical protein